MSDTHGKLILVIGPSGVGKSVILKELRKRHPECVFPKSATTRARRSGEGTDLYRFLTDAEFDRLLQEGQVLEWARVHDGGRYATLKDEILPAIEAGKTVIREVDVQGFESIRAHSLFAGLNPPYRLISIFILPENREKLIRRIEKRAPISAEELAHRIASMDRELGMASLCTVQILNREGKLPETIAQVDSALKL